MTLTFAQERFQMLPGQEEEIFIGNTGAFVLLRYEGLLYGSEEIQALFLCLVPPFLRVKKGELRWKESEVPVNELHNRKKLHTFVFPDEAVYLQHRDYPAITTVVSLREIQGNAILLSRDGKDFSRLYSVGNTLPIELKPPRRTFTFLESAQMASALCTFVFIGILVRSPAEHAAYFVCGVTENMGLQVLR